MNQELEFGVSGFFCFLWFRVGRVLGFRVWGEFGALEVYHAFILLMI